MIGCLGADKNAPDCLQDQLRYGVTEYKKEYSWVCCANQKYAEHSGFHQQVDFFGKLKQEAAAGIGFTIFYDPKCGIPLFVAPKGRSMEEFEKESVSHGWPSFRNEEIIATNVLEKEDGEIVSTCGTHLGHNLPDDKGNRYCINLMCMAGFPAVAAESPASSPNNFNVPAPAPAPATAPATPAPVTATRAPVTATRAPVTATRAPVTATRAPATPETQESTSSSEKDSKPDAAPKKPGFNMFSSDTEGPESSSEKDPQLDELKEDESGGKPLHADVSSIAVRAVHTLAGLAFSLLLGAFF